MAPVIRDDGHSEAPPGSPEPVGADASVPAPRASGQSRRRDPMIGRTIAGRFSIQSLIARGGMGKVYRAEQQPLGRACAVKILNPKYDGEDDPEFRRRFFLEASTASKLTHANTVTIFDYGVDDGVFYIAMEYVAGRTLFRVLREDGPLEEQRVARIIGEVGRSLREAHGIGVIHRDMKPANVVLTESETEGDGVKVLDFGLVKHVEPDEGEDLTEQGLFMGSPKYMAPEQILGHAISPATDIYALGVVAYELLTGEVPFDRGASVKTLMAHVNDPVRPLYETNPDVAISPEMTAVVLRCLEKEAKHRYASIDELLRDLSRVAGGGPMVESLLRMKKVSVPPVAALPGGNRRTEQPDDEDTAPTKSGAIAALEVARQDDSSPPSSSAAPSPSSSTIREPISAEPISEGEPHVSQWPSATPEPMSQLMLDEARPSRRRWLAMAIGVFAAAALGVVALATGDDPTDPLDAATAATDSVEEVRPPAVEAPKEDDAATSETLTRFRVVRVTSDPTGARVREGDQVLCGATPCEVSWRDEAADQAHRLTFSKSGYLDAEVTLDAEPPTEGPETIEGVLRVTPRPAPRPPGAKSKSDAAEPEPKGKPLSGYKDSPY